MLHDHIKYIEQGKQKVRQQGAFSAAFDAVIWESLKSSSCCDPKQYCALCRIVKRYSFKLSCSTSPLKTRSPSPSSRSAVKCSKRGEIDRTSHATLGFERLGTRILNSIYVGLGLGPGLMFDDNSLCAAYPYLVYHPKVASKYSKYPAFSSSKRS